MSQHNPYVNYWKRYYKDTAQTANEIMNYSGAAAGPAQVFFGGYAAAVPVLGSIAALIYTVVNEPSKEFVDFNAISSWTTENQSKLEKLGVPTEEITSNRLAKFLGNFDWYTANGIDKPQRTLTYAQTVQNLPNWSYDVADVESGTYVWGENLNRDRYLSLLDYVKGKLNTTSEKAVWITSVLLYPYNKTSLLHDTFGASPAPYNVSAGTPVPSASESVAGPVKKDVSKTRVRIPELSGKKLVGLGQKTGSISSPASSTYSSSMQRTGAYTYQYQMPLKKGVPANRQRIYAQL